MPAGEPGPTISFGIPWTSYHEGEVGANERMVSYQRKGAHLVTWNFEEEKFTSFITLYTHYLTIMLEQEYEF